MSNILKIGTLINNRVINSEKKENLKSDTVQIFLQRSNKLEVFRL